MTYYPDPATREPRAADQRAGSKSRVGVLFLLGSAVAGALALLVFLVNGTSSYPSDSAMLGAVILVVLWAGLGIVGWSFIGSALTIYLSRDDERWFGH